MLRAPFGGGHGRQADVSGQTPVACVRRVSLFCRNRASCRAVLTFSYRGEFVYEELLKMIEDGHVGLLHAPELTRDASPQGDPRLLWTRWMLRLPSMNAREILAESLRVAAEQFANTSEADLPQAIEKEIARDLRRMQIQPTVVDNYRRFVVITSRSDKYFAEDSAGVSSNCDTIQPSPC